LISLKLRAVVPVAGAKVKAGLRRLGAGPQGRYLLSGLLRCSVCGASFTLSNAERYQCASHHDGGPSACDVSRSVPRTRVEEVIKGFIEDDLLDTGRLIEVGERYRAATASGIVIDHGPQIAKLEKDRVNLVAAIKAGGLAAELGPELKAISCSPTTQASTCGRCSCTTRARPGSICSTTPRRSGSLQRPRRRSPRSRRTRKE
jgi:hypothetical protein